MAYEKYIVNGRELLNLDDLGMVDYNEYYSLWENSDKRRDGIYNQFHLEQQNNMLENEPDIDDFYQYKDFLDKLKITNLDTDIYNQKSNLFKEYGNKLNEEKETFNEEKKQLLLKWYPFDPKMKKYGYYVFKINDNYYQYKLVSQNGVKIDMGDRLLPLLADISDYKIIPITPEELQIIEMDILKKSRNVPLSSHGFKK